MNAMQQRTIMGNAPSTLIDGATVNIDTEEDLLWAEFLWQQNEGVMRKLIRNENHYF